MKKPKGGKAGKVRRAIELAEQRLNSEVKLTGADLLRLLQLDKDREPDQPQEIKVTWVDPDKIEPVSCQ
jgi:hypothetical protein